MPERFLQGPINNNGAFLFEEEMSSERLNPWPASTSSSHEACFADLVPGYNPSMPFLKLLQSAVEGARADETQKEPIFSSPSPHESNLHLLLRLQNQNQHNSSLKASMESCITLCSDLHEKSSVPLSAAMRPCAAKRRRKRPRVSLKKPEETECQRITHINIERNRRKLMNEHLATLKSLIPPSLVPRGDQASIIGGAIDYVKELEQVLLFSQSEKKARTAETQHTGCSRFGGEFGSVVKREEGEEAVAVEAKVVQGHVNLKVAGKREARRLACIISALEELRLTVLHLTVTTIDYHLVIYCFNLKMEEDCRLQSADEIAAAVHQILSY